MRMRMRQSPKREKKEKEKEIEKNSTLKKIHESQTQTNQLGPKGRVWCCSSKVFRRKVALIWSIDLTINKKERKNYLTKIFL